MDYQLTVDAIARRAEVLAKNKAVIGYRSDGSFVETTWGATLSRARALAAGLSRLGVSPGDRVATAAWNCCEHLEAYFGVPIMGAALHTLNTRLGTPETVAILRDAGSRVLIADSSLTDFADALRHETDLDHVIMFGPSVPSWAISYEEVVAAGKSANFATPDVEERETCSLCYTTGTTGRAKGVTYSHRALAIQSLVLTASDLEGIREDDVVMVVVPMFHANAWGHPYAAALVGASLVLPHRDLGPENLLALIERHGVTNTGGVPTVWEPVLRLLDADPGRFDASSVRLIRFGGARAPMALMRGFEERHGVHVAQGWGMTELSPLGGVSVPIARMSDESDDVVWRVRGKQGRPAPFLEQRIRTVDDEIAPWDGSTVGELELRGPSVASGYLNGRGSDSFTDDGWLRTGDMATIDEDGYLEIVDRAKDLIKSGGEWISSLALEHTLGEHPDVHDAAVIAVQDERWGERPLAVVVLLDGIAPDPQALIGHLRLRHPGWWVPERFEFVDMIPRTAAGKIRKVDLRAQYVESALG